MYVTDLVSRRRAGVGKAISVLRAKLARTRAAALGSNTAETVSNVSKRLGAGVTAADMATQQTAKTYYENTLKNLSGQTDEENFFNPKNYARYAPCYVVTVVVTVKLKDFNEPFVFTRNYLPENVYFNCDKDANKVRNRVADKLAKAQADPTQRGQAPGIPPRCLSPYC